MYSASAVRGACAMDNQFPNVFQGENFPNATITHIRAADNICLVENGMRCGADDYTQITYGLLGTLVNPVHGMLDDDFMESSIARDLACSSDFATFRAITLHTWQDPAHCNIFRYPGGLDASITPYLVH